jgi:hypothetical protein
MDCGLYVCTVIQRLTPWSKSLHRGSKFYTVAQVFVCLHRGSDFITEVQGIGQATTHNKARLGKYTKLKLLLY